MACACQGRQAKSKFMWFKDEGVTPIVYDTEIQAKAKVLRKGGTYVPYNPDIPLAPQLAAARG
jgi:hypothetical protein